MGDVDSVSLWSKDGKLQKTWIPVRWKGDRIELPLPDRTPGGEAELTFEERRTAAMVVTAARE